MSENPSSIEQFLYRPELVEAGTVYHYIKSNIDGSYPARIFIYVLDHDHLEVLKFEEHGMGAALVKAHMIGRSSRQTNSNPGGSPPMESVSAIVRLYRCRDQTFEN